MTHFFLSILNTLDLPFPLIIAKTKRILFCVLEMNKNSLKKPVGGVKQVASWVIAPHAHAGLPGVTHPALLVQPPRGITCPLYPTYFCSFGFPACTSIVAQSAHLLNESCQSSKNLGAQRCRWLYLCTVVYYMYIFALFRVFGAPRYLKLCKI
jgi:hypothetical protein